MKKKLATIVFIAICLFACAFGLAACKKDPPPDIQPPKAPVLEKSSFAVLYTTDENGTANYKLTWDADGAENFSVVCNDGAPQVISKKEFSLNGFAADTVHAVTVTAIGPQNTQSEPVTVKFKGTKLTAPYNVRLYGDTNGFGFKGCDDTQAYVIYCEELDLDIQTSRPVYTGKIKSVPVYSERLTINDLRNIYSELDLYALESFRVQALPYDGNSRCVEYENGTDVLEFQLPSDVSEQSVNFYAGEMSNPSNLRWDFDGFDEHPGYATVKWDGALSEYKYKVMVEHPEGYFTGTATEKGASQSNVFSDYATVTGEYGITVQSVCDEFNFIGEDKNEKWVTYSFRLSQPVTETLKFKADQTTLKNPENIRIEGENIVWDKVDFAKYYGVKMQRGETELAFHPQTEQLSFKEIFEKTDIDDDLNGDYEISVIAYEKSPELLNTANGVPTIKTYRYSDYGICEKAIRLRSVDKVKNVNVDYENNTVSWDEADGATGYRIALYRDDGNGFGRTLGAATQYVWSEDISEYTRIVITAACEYQVTDDNGVTVITVPSKYILNL